MKIISILLLCIFISGAGRSTQFEQKDLLGTTTNFQASVGTTFIAIPTVAGNPIAEAFVRCPTQTPNTRRLEVSFTSSTGPWVVLRPGEFIGWSIKGYMKQIWIKGNAASVDYEVILNREP